MKPGGTLGLLLGELSELDTWFQEVSSAIFFLQPTPCLSEWGYPPRGKSDKEVSHDQGYLRSKMQIEI